MVSTGAAVMALIVTSAPKAAFPVADAAEQTPTLRWVPLARSPPRAVRSS